MIGGVTITNGAQTNYTWDSENRLLSVKNDSESASYSYDTSGDRVSKLVETGETFYPDQSYQEYSRNGERIHTKHIFVGKDRLVSIVGYTEGTTDTSYEQAHTYYYHNDHLGSVSAVTDYTGSVYERNYYMPYGETWIDITNDNLGLLNYGFTGKEVDKETGFVYFGARYLDPRTSRWISADPALEKYVPEYPGDEGAEEHNGNLPGEGGVFNPINFAVYHYAGNNPIKYTDPSGNQILKVTNQYYQNGLGNGQGKILYKAGGSKKVGDYSYNTIGTSSNRIYDQGCRLTALTRVANAIDGKSQTPEEINKIAIDNKLFDSDGTGISTENASKLLSIVIGKSVSISSTPAGVTKDQIKKMISDEKDSKSNVFLMLGVKSGDFKHFMNVNDDVNKTPEILDTSTSSRTWNNENETPFRLEVITCGDK